MFVEIEEKKCANLNAGKTTSMHAKLLLSCPILCDPMDCVACQASLSMGFFMQEYWSRLPFPSPGDLHNPGVEPTSRLLY